MATTVSGLMPTLMIRGTEPVQDALRRKYGSSVGGIYRVSTYASVFAGANPTISQSGVQCDSVNNAVHLQASAHAACNGVQAIGSNGELYLSNPNEIYGHGNSACTNQKKPDNHFWKAVEVSDVIDCKRYATGYTTFFRKPDLTLWFFGPNTKSEGGDQSALYKESPTPVGSGRFANVDIVDYDISSALSGGPYGVFVDSLGRLWGAGNVGSDLNGAAYGISGTLYQTFPAVVQVSGIPNSVVKVACGDYSTFIVDSSGYVYSTGRNQQNLGTINTDHRFSFIKLDEPSGIVDIFASAYSCYALDVNGDVWSWGQNSYGELGRTTDATNRYYAVKIPTLSGIVDVVPSLNFVFFKDRDGIFYSCGRNHYGQLCRGYSNTGVNATPLPVSGGMSLFKTASVIQSMAGTAFASYFIAPTQTIPLYIKGIIGTPSSPWASGVCRDSKCILYHPMDNEYESTTGAYFQPRDFDDYLYPQFNNSLVNGLKLRAFDSWSGRNLMSGLVPSCITTSGSVKNTYTFWSAMSSGSSTDQQRIELLWMNNDGAYNTKLNGIVLENALGVSTNGKYNIVVASNGNVNTSYAFETLRPPATISGVPTFYAITTEISAGKVVIGLSVNGSAFEYSPALSPTTSTFTADNTVYPAFRFNIFEFVAPKSGTDKMWLDEVAIWRDVNLKAYEVNNIYKLGTQQKALSDYFSTYGVTNDIPLFMRAIGAPSGSIPLCLGSFAASSGHARLSERGHIVSSGTATSFVYGKPAGSVELWMHAMEPTPPQPPVPVPTAGSTIGLDFKPQLVGNLGYTGSELVYIQIWKLKDGEAEQISLVDNSCYPIGNTGRWGWSTEELMPIAEHRVQYHYYMTVAGEEGGPYDFHGDFVIKRKGKMVHGWNDFSRQYVTRSDV